MKKLMAELHKVRPFFTKTSPTVERKEKPEQNQYVIKRIRLKR